MLLENELNVLDETVFGDPVAERVLSFNTLTVTVRAVIIERVRDEVKRLHSSGGGDESIESLLIKYGIRIDEKDAIDEAIGAFESNQYFVLLENEQVESLEQVVDLSQTDTISFVRITPLAGG